MSNLYTIGYFSNKPSDELINGIAKYSFLATYYITDASYSSNN